MEALLNNCRVATVHEFINLFVILFTITAIIQFSYIKVVLSWCYTKIQTSSELAVQKTPKVTPPPHHSYPAPYTNHLYRCHGMASELHVNDYWFLVFKLSLFHLNTRLLKLVSV